MVAMNGKEGTGLQEWVKQANCVWNVNLGRIIELAFIHLFTDIVLAIINHMLRVQLVD
jgi:hypothetical protein